MKTFREAVASFLFSRRVDATAAAKPADPLQDRRGKLESTLARIGARLRDTVSADELPPR
jgi:hypothetical protein